MSFASLSNDEQVARLAALAERALRAWDVSEPRIELVKYRENAVFAVIFGDGTRTILRIHRPRYRTDGAIRSEIAWMHALADAGVQTPSAIRTRGGDYLTTVSADGVPEPRQCDLTTWVSGRPPGTLEAGVTADDDRIRALYREVGALAARMHAHAAEWTPPPWFERPFWDVEALVGETPTFGRFWELDVVEPEQMRTLLAARDRARERLAALELPRALIHGDLVPDNILVDGDTTRVIDFDDCGWSWIAFEMTTSLFPLQVSGGFDAGLAGYVEGYTLVRPFPEEQLAFLPDMLMARGLSYLGWSVGRPEIESARNLTPMFVYMMSDAAERYLRTAQAGSATGRRIAMAGTQDRTDPPSSSADASAENEEDFAALLEQSERDAAPRRINVGDRVTGKVIALGETSVFVAIGDKGEAVIDAAEFRDPDTGEIGVAIGDSIEATVVDDGSRTGSPVLRRAMGRGGHVAAELEEAFAHDLAVEGLVVAETKGGFDVQIGRMRAFCPGSQIDYRRGGERVAGAEYIGKRFPFRITKLEQGGRNLVVSRRVLLEAEAASAAERTWESIHVGAVLDGTVSSVRDFGAFVDLGGGVEGMIHVSELSYSRVEHPSHVLSVGQPVRVQVVKLDDKTDSRGRRQIGLSLRTLAEDPWTTVAQRFPAGAGVSGIVRRLEAYGAFVEIAPGVEGLVHISKITSERRLVHARQALAVGQSVDVTVLAVDPAQRRISLSMVERAKQRREASERSDRDEEQRALAEINKPKSFGTFADLIEKAKRK